MPRVKASVTRRAHHKKVLVSTKGYRMTKSRLYKVAHEAALHAGEYAFDGRKKKKSDFRGLWIRRISAGLNLVNADLSYSKFIKAMSDKKIEINRKMLSLLAVKEPKAFETVVKSVSK